MVHGDCILSAEIMQVHLRRDPVLLYNIYMNIILRGHDYRYAVEQMLLTLYPDERPVYPDAPGGADCVEVSLRRGKRYAVAVCRLTRGGRSARAQARFALEKAEERVDAVRLEQRIVKLAFYRAALALGREKPVWGSLTGVRPAKFFVNLMERDGMSFAEARRALVREHGVDPDRAELCAQAAEAALAARSSLSPEDVCLYVGIPYCPTRCAYCSFVSVEAPKLLKTIPDYLDALEREIDAVAEAVRESSRRVISVYVGGGTPTTLSAPDLDRLLRKLRAAFDLRACREFTVEAGRPDTVTEEKLAVLAACGVDRVSVNPQTMSDEVLRAIGRHHTAAQVIEAVEAVRRAGSFALNMDLIAGLPGDTPAGFSRTLGSVLGFGPENVTVHTLALKKGSKFLTEGTTLPDGGAVGAMLDTARERLGAAGYLPYYLYRQKFMSGSFENIGWTKPGCENLYNICIMEELCPILAMGAGGSTKLVAPGGIVRRLTAPKYPKEYMERVADTCAAKAQIPAFFLSPAPKGD